MKNTLLMKSYFVRSFCLCAISFISTITFSQTVPMIQWQKSIGGSFYDGATAVDTTSDGGYIIGGYTKSTNGDVIGNHGGYDMWLVKLTTVGTIDWQKCYGGTRDEEASSIQHTRDGGYILIGYTTSNNGDVSGNTDTLSGNIWVVKVSGIGMIQWQKIFGGSAFDKGNKIIQTNDGGYIFTGYTKSIDGNIIGHHGTSSTKDMCVVKLDSLGAIQWQKSLGGTSSEDGNDILTTPNGDYLIVGYAASNDGDLAAMPSVKKGWLIKLSSAGNISWSKRYGGSLFDEISSIMPTFGNRYILNLQSTSSDSDAVGNHGNFDGCIVTIDSAGNVLKSKCFGGSDEEETSAYATSDGGYLIYGLTTTPNDGDISGMHGGSDMWLAKVDSTGMLQWQKPFGGTGQEFAYDVLQTSDKGYIVVGYSDSANGDITINKGLEDAWIIKLDKDSTLLNLPLNLYSFTGVLQNNEVELQWQTAQEQNTDKFIVERSSNFRNYNPVGSKEAAGNSTSTRKYLLRDKEPLTGTNFYRLRMVDKDGSFTFSRVIVINVSTIINKLHVYPNPAKNILQIQGFEGNEKVSLQITNSIGETVKMQVVQLNGSGSYSLDINTLKSGKYFIALQGKTERKIIEFIKL